MNNIDSGTLHVPGANLFYKIGGSGPLLLMIAGGGGSAESFEGVARYLVNSYTVVTYDPRGIFRSKLDDPAQDVFLETHSNDAHSLLQHLTKEPAYVFGSSAGAIIGLDLAARYSELVHILVAHEPPQHNMLLHAEPSHEHLLSTMRREGEEPALRMFAAQLGVNYEKMEEGARLPHQEGEQKVAAARSFFSYILPAVRRYRIDREALLAASTHIVIAGGSAGREYLGYRSATSVAKLLGTKVVEFPGHHAGYVSHPRAFAERLHTVLATCSEI